MGAQFHLPIHCDKSWSDIELYARRAQLPVYVATGTAVDSKQESHVYSDIDWTDRVAIVVGSEADGASDDAFAVAQNRITIPMAADVESLNAAMAGTVILFEIHRQRLAHELKKGNSTC